MSMLLEHRRLKIQKIKDENGECIITHIHTRHTHHLFKKNNTVFTAKNR